VKGGVFQPQDLDGSKQGVGGGLPFVPFCPQGGVRVFEVFELAGECLDALLLLGFSGGAGFVLLGGERGEAVTEVAAGALGDVVAIDACFAGQPGLAQ
jgi:hypothetical protein